jgi:hypothetical protein
MRNSYKILVEKPEEEIIGRKYLLKLVLIKYPVKMWAGFMYLLTGTHGRLLLTF